MKLPQNPWSWKLGAALAVPIILFLYFRASAEDRIRARIQELEQAVPVVLAQPPLEQMLSVRRYARLLSDPVELEVVDGGNERSLSYSRQRIEQLAQGGVRSFDTLEVQLKDIEVMVDGPAAEAKLELHALGSTDGRNDKFYDNWELVVHWRRVDGDWLIAKVAARNLRS